MTAFATVCLTIDYAHSHGVIHRDLKPANIMLGDFGEVYVLDWAVARVVAQDAAAPDPTAPPNSKPGELLGTPLYMAPEQFVDSEVGPSADVFALGAILFEVLALEPLRDPRAAFVPFDARPPRRAPDRVIAPELDAICAQATVLDPARRFLAPRALHQAVWRYPEGDRELAQRRARAAEHAGAARDALAKSDAPGPDSEVHRGVAMRELARARALDPTDDARARASRTADHEPRAGHRDRLVAGLDRRHEPDLRPADHDADVRRDPFDRRAGASASQRASRERGDVARRDGVARAARAHGLAARVVRVRRRSHLLALPRLGTLVLLVGIDICVMLVPSVFIARMRGDLTDAQARLHVRAWHFRRVGHELTRG
ncbi:MAG TPA: protein kinase [Kofleriaceae bacterium]|nr:protein kinase [Kofleriaceae bacterium]